MSSDGESNIQWFSSDGVVTSNAVIDLSDDIDIHLDHLMT